MMRSNKVGQLPPLLNPSPLPVASEVSMVSTSLLPKLGWIATELTPPIVTSPNVSEDTIASASTSLPPTKLSVILSPLTPPAEQRSQFKIINVKGGSCNVLVHDFGVGKDDKPRYQINGKDVDPDFKGSHLNANPANAGPVDGSIFVQPSHKQTDYDTLTMLLELLPEVQASRRPAWASVRWIDVNGHRQDIIEYLISEYTRMRHHAIREVSGSIMNRLAQTIGMQLDADMACLQSNYLLISKCAQLSVYAAKLMEQDEDGDSKFLFSSMPLNSGIMASETVAFVLCTETVATPHHPTVRTYLPPKACGTLLTFQSDKGKDSFCDFHTDLLESIFSVRSCDTYYFFFRALKASIIGVAKGVLFIDEALAQLGSVLQLTSDAFARKDIGMEVYKEKISDLSKSAKNLQFELHGLVLNLEPILDVMQNPGFIADGPMGLKGNGTMVDNDIGCARAWGEMASTQKQLLLQIKLLLNKATQQQQLHARFVKELESDRNRLADSNAIMMGIFFGIFAPMGFIAGVYGTNFVKPNGDPALPELSWYGKDTVDQGQVSFTTGLTGYQYFWLLEGTVFIGILLLYLLLRNRHQWRKWFSKMYHQWEKLKA